MRHTSIPAYVRRASVAALALGCVLMGAACTSASGSDAPTFVPSPGGFPSEGPGVRISPIVPGPPAGGGGGTGGGTGSPGSPSPSPTSKTDPLVVATKLTAPVGLTMLPDNTALVGERTTGRIVRVQSVAGRPVTTVRTLPGLDYSGDGGLLDLALSPEYSQDNLIYAYVSTRTDNRVVDFTLDGPVTPVLTGIPHGSTGNAGRIAFAADGDLYIGTGDAGRAAAATNPASLAGKVLRVDGIGQPADGNPKATSPIFTSGHQGAAGLCPVPQTTTVLEVEPGRDGTGGEINTLTAGASYGYPATGGGGTRAATATLPRTTPAPGDCAVSANRLWVTSPGAQSLLSAPLTPASTGSSFQIGSFTAVLAKKYGRLLTVVAATDGALWLTTTNRDGSGKPVSADERVIRYVPSAASTKPDLPV